MIFWGCFGLESKGDTLIAGSWHIPFDLSSDGRVNLTDFAEFASSWLEDDGELNLVADFDFDGAISFDDLNLFLPYWYENYTQQIARRTVPVVSSSQLVPEIICGKDNLKLCCENETYVFATDTNGDVYRRAKPAGSAWELAASGVADVIWTLWGDSLFGVNSSTVFRFSQDHGTTWQECAVPPGITPGASFYPGWSLAFRKPGQGGESINSYGTMVLVEYGLQLDKESRKRKIFRSVDQGNTWTCQYEFDIAAEVVDPNVNNHFHTVAYNSSLKRFLAIVGDGINAQMKYSDDDGITWIAAQLNSGVQPVQLIDLGNSEFLCGADKSIGVYTMDIADMEAVVKHQKIKNWNDLKGAQRYCFMLKYLDGIYYAFNFDYISYPRYPKIAVSSDLENWPVYYQFTNVEQGVRFVGGISEDGVHVTYLDGTKVQHSALLSRPSIEMKPALNIQPAVDNIFSDICYGDNEDSPTKWIATATGSAVITSDPNGGLFADRHIKIEKGANGYIAAQIPFYKYFVPCDGRSYVGRMWLRGVSANQIAGIQVGSARAGYSKGGYIALINKNDWLEIITEPITVPALGGVEPVVFKIYAGSSGYPLAGDAQLHIGGICMSSQRGGLQLSGSGCFYDELRKTVEVGQSWSSFFRIIADNRASAMSQYGFWSSHVTYPDGVCVLLNSKTWESLQAENLGNNPLAGLPYWQQVDNYRWHIKTWMADIRNYMTLYLDSLDKKIKVNIVKDGQVLEILSTAKAINFEWMSQLDFEIAVWKNSSAIRLYVSNAGYEETCLSSSAAVQDAVLNGYMQNCSIMQLVGSQEWLSSLNTDGQKRGDMTTLPMFMVDEDDLESSL